MTVPSHSERLEPPAFISELAGDVDPVPVWRNGIGGVTWCIGTSYIKVGPPHPEFEPSKEAERIAWLRSLELPFQIPRILEALRSFHDHVPVTDCPVTWGPLTGDEDLVVRRGDA